jgi:hypothetical protein
MVKKESKKGGMMEMSINPNATPMTNFDLAHGYSTLQNGGKSKRGRKSTKGGTMELNPSTNPMVNADLAHGLSTLTGGKKPRKTKKGGADPNLGGNSAFYNMNHMVQTDSPYAMADANVNAANAPSPFSAGMPNYASVEYGLPITMTNSLTGGLDQSVPTVGGGKKVRKSSGRKNKKGGELSIMGDIDKLLERLNTSEEVKGGKGKKSKKSGKKTKKGGADGDVVPTVVDSVPVVTPVVAPVASSEPVAGQSSELLPPPPAELALLQTPEKVGGKGKRGRKSKNGGGDTLAKLLTIQGGNSEFTGANDWQTQLALDNASNMPGGGKSKRKSKNKNKK